MQLIWYLPSLLIGLSVGISSGYWQLALISALMVSVMAGTNLYKNRYQKFTDQDPVYLSGSQVAISNRVLPRFPIFWKAEWHQLFLTSIQLTEKTGEFDERYLIRQETNFAVSAKDLGFWLGVGQKSELEVDLATEGPHLLIVGPTGSGKSELLKLILISLLASNDCKLALFDFKGGATLEPFGNYSVGLATDLDSSSQVRLWELIALELESREQLFADHNVSDIEALNLSGQKLARMVVVIDEFAAALASGLLAQKTIEDVAARGRSLGVHLIVATQSLSGIQRSMLTNLRARIAMASSDPIDMVQLGINPAKYQLMNLAGWGSAIISRSNQDASSFCFPLGARQALPKGFDAKVSAPLQPARSQALRQMYLTQEPEPDPPLQQPSSPDSQLLLRMEGLRLSEHR